MEYQITISDRAKSKTEAIFEYLEQEWSEKIKDDFKLKLLQQVDFLRQNPFMFPISKKKDIRKCLVTKHNILYFKILKDEVQIITIQDTRSNPNTLKL